ncbi:MAG: hypothetical protein QM572_01410 [Nocardioides sp.]|uniref:hypothetical protein n=1 Tax=Nocardioides sp. TaxID=35761 RepID=UPI0039E3CB7D
MSKRGREQNRVRRAVIGEGPGAGWTASRASEDVVALAKTIGEKYADNPIALWMGANLSTAEVNGLASVGFSAANLDAAIGRTALPQELRGKVSALARDASFGPAFSIAAYERAYTHMRRRATAGKTGQAYVLSPTLHTVVCAAARDLTHEDLLTITDDDLLDAHGVLLLPFEQPVANRSGEVAYYVRAMTWSVAHTPAAGRYVEISQWTAQPTIHSSVGALRDAAKRMGYPLQPLIPESANNLVLTDGEGVDAATTTSLDHERAALALKADDTIAPAVDPESYAVMGEPVPDALANFTQRYLFAFMRLAAQRTTAVSKPPAVHANGATIRVPNHEAVRVVTLRSATTIQPEGVGAPPRKYHHRFVVKMHKVRQWYPSEQRHKVIWRGPYVKGPQDAEWLTGEKVYALTR